MENGRFLELVDELQAVINQSAPCCMFHAAHACIVVAAGAMADEHGSDEAALTEELNMLWAQTMKCVREGKITLTPERLQS